MGAASSSHQQIAHPSLNKALLVDEEERQHEEGEVVDAVAHRANEDGEVDRLDTLEAQQQPHEGDMAMEQHEADVIDDFQLERPSVVQLRQNPGVQLILRFAGLQRRIPWTSPWVIFRIGWPLALVACILGNVEYIVTEFTGSGKDGDDWAYQKEGAW